MDVAEPLSTSRLTTQIGVAIQTLANTEAFFADLAGAGLLERDNLGASKAAKWCTPYRSRPSDGLRRTQLISGVENTGCSLGSDCPVDRLAKWCFAASHRNIDYGSDWFLEGTTPGGNLDPLLERQTELAPMVRLVLVLLADDLRGLPWIECSASLPSPLLVVFRDLSLRWPCSHWVGLRHRR
ncbi:hypothetical protein [Haloarcula laminariae]|uniref:hypothetical protein n=1 Tax=Haloarcula laminariae TaxID=2961577 RepID=UPI002406000C|nr:hypothetical protein [Halomicroarcula sp. FL173]